MEDPSYKEWVAAEHLRSEELNQQHAARLAEMATSHDDLSPQERAERDAHLVKSSDDLIREAEGRPHPPEGHDVRDFRSPAMQRAIDEAVGPDVDREALKAEIKAELLTELRDVE